MRNNKDDGLTMPHQFKSIIQDYIPYNAYGLHHHVGIKLVTFKEDNLRSIMRDITDRFTIEKIVSKHNEYMMTKGSHQKKKLHILRTCHKGWVGTNFKT